MGTYERALAADAAMVKVVATDTMEFCANEAMQIFGGAGYMGGGSVEIMKDLAARQMGL